MTVIHNCNFAHSHVTFYMTCHIMLIVILLFCYLYNMLCPSWHEVVINNALFFLFHFFLLVPPEFVLAPPSSKQVRSIWNYDTVCRMILLFSTAWPTLVWVLCRQTFLATASDLLQQQATTLHLLPCMQQCVVFYSTPVRAGAEYCGQLICLSVLLSVSPRAYLRNRWTDLHQILHAHPLWLGPALAALRCVMYFQFYGWCHVWP